ncbi:MAG: glycan-binding surface protein [Prevotellaceae bacterium]|nr:glycan-binding surface protein [Prevotellaceae bacterium]
MKNVINKNLFIWLVIMSISMAFTSCKDDDNDNLNTPMKITAVYLEDAQSSVPDRLVEYARLGQTLRLEGSGFNGLQKIYINGRSTFFNTALLTDVNVLVSISGETPILDADPSLRNTIVLEKNGNQYTYSFEIRSAAPAITSVSHTMPQAGDEITIYGTGLQGIERVIFPGDVVVTENNIISDNVDGKFCIVTVPAGVSDEGGALFVEGLNGGAYSPAYFNFKKGLFHNFDDVNNYSWAPGIDDAGTPLTDVIPATGSRPKSQGGYHSFNAAGATIAASADKRYWTNSTDWPSALLNVIPGNTATNMVAVQMDIYVEGNWNSGLIRMVMADGSGTDRYCMLYRPWYRNGAIVPFENPGCWYTVTLPFGDSDDYSGKTFADVVASMANASYKQAGPWFHNIGIADVFEPEATEVKVYFDNLRVVPLDTPVYDEFGDE